MNNLINYIDPATAIAVVAFIYNVLKPVLKSIHLSKNEQNVLLATKRAVTFAAQKADLDNVQRRVMAEKLIAEWLVSHNIQMSNDAIRTYIEYAYQILKNNNDIDIKQININGGTK